MNKKLLLAPDRTLFEALKEIESELENSGHLIVDMTQVRFPLTRDVFFVLSKRFRGKMIEFLLPHEYEVQMAHSVHLTARVSTMHADFDREFTKKNLLKHNYTMREYFLYELRRGYEYIRFLIQRKKPKSPKYRAPSGMPNMFLIVSGLIVSLTLLLFIFHFAVSKTYVSVLPQISVRPIISNIVFTLQDVSSWSLFAAKNTVKMKRVSYPVEQELTFTLDTIDPNSTTNAIGTVIVYNELPQDQALKPNTRFVTEDGIVYRSDTWVNVPGAKTINGITEIGVAEVLLKADQKDEAGAIIGNRGNIGATTLLTIPGLKFNRDKVYAKAKDDFIGGSDPMVHILTEEELKRFQSSLRDQLQKTARTLLQTRIDTENQERNEKYALLTAESLSVSGEVLTITSGQKVGDLANEITMRGQLTVSALVYDQKWVRDYLTTIFRDKLLYGTDKELAIYDELKLTNIVSRSERDETIKATMEMSAAVTYDLENATNELTKRMKMMIAGLGRDEAISKLINEWYVREVDITFSPFWMRTVSTNLDNIEFIIRNEK